VVGSGLANGDDPTSRDGASGASEARAGETRASEEGAE
jgi:hypothetical protein